MYKQLLSSDIRNLVKSFWHMIDWSQAVLYQHLGIPAKLLLSLLYNAMVILEVKLEYYTNHQCRLVSFLNPYDKPNTSLYCALLTARKKASKHVRACMQVKSVQRRVDRKVNKNQKVKTEKKIVNCINWMTFKVI